MGLLEYLKKIFGDEEGQKAYDKINSDKDTVLLVDDKKASKYVEKADLDTANNSIKDYKKQLKERDTQLNDIQGKVKDNETLTKEIETLKDANEKATKDYEAQLSQIDFNNKFEKALGSYKPKNAKAIKALLDMEKVKLDGENFLGLEDQIKTLKESDSYLFAEETLGGTGSLGGGQSSFLDDKTGGSLGERLAKDKAETVKATESQNNFFK